MHARIVTLSDKESRALFEVERTIQEWERAKPFSNREQPQWDICETIIHDLRYLRNEVLLASNRTELSNTVEILPPLMVEGL